MFRLVAVARGIDRALDGGLWPGQGPSDERLLIMAETSPGPPNNQPRSRGASPIPHRRHGAIRLMGTATPCMCCT